MAGADRMSETERALVVAARTWCGLYVFGGLVEILTLPYTKYHF